MWWVFGDLPGADDNASGVSGLLEICRLLKTHQNELKNRVDLVAYTLEEPPFFRQEEKGSMQHVKYLKENNIKIKSMICLEMIGYFTFKKCPKYFRNRNGKWFFVKDILAKENSITYIGTDYSEIMINEATQINKEIIQNKQVSFIQLETKKLPFHDNNTLYFWENPLIELSEIKRVLKQNGKLFLGIRSKKVMQELPFTTYNFTLYEPNDARDLFQKNDFKNIEIIEKEEPVQMMGEHPIKMDTVIVFGEK